MNPLQTAKLSEEQIQDVLAFALGEGGLAAARPEYLNQMIADASTAIFTIDTGRHQEDGLGLRARAWTTRRAPTRRPGPRSSGWPIDWSASAAAAR